MATDVLHMVVVHESTGESYSAYGSTRHDGSETLGGLPITAANKGDYAAYLYFERADGSDASPSAYHAIA